MLGTGRMGAGIVDLLLRTEGVELTGVYARRRERAGLDVGEAVGLGRPLGIAVSGGLAALCRTTRPHVAIQATCSRVSDARDEIATLVTHGVNVISIAEEMAYPRVTSDDIAAALDALAVANSVTVLGTGINPGFVLDTLAIALSGVCQRVDRIRAQRVNDLAPYGPTVLAAQGVGLEPAAFREGVERGEVVGHVGFPQSIAMIGQALGWTIERVEEQREPIVSRVERRTALVTVQPGRVAGCLHTATAYAAGRPVIELVHPQQIRPELEGVATGDSIAITGRPSFEFSARPEIPGGIATVALAVNMVAHVMNAAPGLRTMAELPVPAAVVGDVRRRLRVPLEAATRG